MRRCSPLWPRMGSPRAACGYGGLSAPYGRRAAVAGHSPENRLAAAGAHAGGAKLLPIYQRIAKCTGTGGTEPIGNCVSLGRNGFRVARDFKQLRHVDSARLPTEPSSRGAWREDFPEPRVLRNACPRADECNGDFATAWACSDKQVRGSIKSWRDVAQSWR